MGALARASRGRRRPPGLPPRVLRRVDLHGEIPLWNPLGFAGAPHLANYQSAPLYPLSLLAAPLPFETGQLAIVLTHLFGAGFFTWLFLRRESEGDINRHGPRAHPAT